MCVFFPDFLPMLGVPLLIFDPQLLWRDDGDGVAPDEDGAEFPRDFAVYAFFCLFEHDIDVDVEGDECADVLAAVLEFDDDSLVSCFVECV